MIAEIYMSQFAILQHAEFETVTNTVWQKLLSIRLCLHTSLFAALGTFDIRDDFEAFVMDTPQRLPSTSPRPLFLSLNLNGDIASVSHHIFSTTQLLYCALTCSCMFGYLLF
jgi:hypothetical protein